MRAVHVVCMLCVAVVAMRVEARPKTKREILVEQGDKTLDEAAARQQEGEFAKSVELSKSVVDARIRALGAGDPNTADAHEQLGVTLMVWGKLDEAGEHLRRALAIREKALGKDADEVASSLHNLGKLADNRGEYARAIELFERTVTIRRKHHPPDHPYLTAAMTAAATAYARLDRYDEADKLLEEVLVAQAKAPESQSLANTWNMVGILAENRGEFAKALEAYQKTVGIMERVLGKDHPQLAVGLTNLSNVYSYLAKYDEALAALERARAIDEKVFGEDNPQLGLILASIAGVYDEMGLWKQAIPVHERALAILVKTLGPTHNHVGGVLQNVGRSYREAGDYARAIAVFERAAQITREAKGERSSDLAIVDVNLADTYKQMRDYPRARAHYDAALATYEALKIADHPLIANALSGLAALDEAEGHHDLAERHYLAGIAQQVKVVGANHTNVGQAKQVYGQFLMRRGRFQEALALVSEALAIQRATKQPKHLRAAQYLLALGKIQLGLHRDAEAEAAYKEGLALFDEEYPGHPERAFGLQGLANLYALRGELAKSIATRREAEVIRERTLPAMLAVGSEAQKLKFVETLREDTEQTLGFNIQTAPTDEAATRLALTVVLQRKGRVLDAVSATLAGIRSRGSETDRALLADLERTRAELSAWILRGPGSLATSIGVYRDRLALLTARLDELDRKLGATLATEHKTVTLDDVQQVLPPGAALVELVATHDVDPRAPGVGSARYVAYVLHGGGAPVLVDLGDAAAIDRAAQRLREALADPQRANVHTHARAVDELVMRPIRAHLGDARELVVAPDGVLNLVPFATLLDETGHPLVERYLISYLSSGRELVRGQRRSPPRGPSVIVGGPAYAAPSADATFEFSPLPGTAVEAGELGKLMPAARVLVGEAASEPALKALAGPEILHVATHGFFLTSGREIAEGSRALRRRKRTTRAPTNPLLLSGLALSGANAGTDGDEDGILTALEVSGLDLRGTRLVTLSACETGVGEIRNGDGVFGLRRALVMAGSETQVMSLWKVDDAATAKLMVAYYRALQAGRGRAAAMREVQLAMLEDPRWSHPYFWGAFIVSGETTALDGTRVPPVLAASRGPRGCACGTTEPTWSHLVIVMAVALGVARRRRRPVGPRPTPRRGERYFVPNRRSPASPRPGTM